MRAPASGVCVRWHNRREEHVAAELHDVSAQGVFLAPEGVMPSEIVAGDPVWIAVPGEAGEVTLSGVIRWLGFHPAHGHAGCGIQLDAAGSAALKRLFPDIDV